MFLCSLTIRSTLTIICIIHYNNCLCCPLFSLVQNFWNQLPPLSAIFSFRCNSFLYCIISHKHCFQLQHQVSSPPLRFIILNSDPSTFTDESDASVFKRLLICLSSPKSDASIFKRLLICLSSP
ncbi:hypothetical protein C5167_013870 [Papaver somniferum]|uniref:Uncharacterized protein n=1 Tax=Papaver somniferum TaxID=3469 RepID=A0A4Y7J500_PAPSO|nr:hypothetical protein C5167_013870 [Papaver somniferum]